MCEKSINKIRIQRLEYSSDPTGCGDEVIMRARVCSFWRFDCLYIIVRLALGTIPDGVASDLLAERTSHERLMHCKRSKSSLTTLGITLLVLTTVWAVGNPEVGKGANTQDNWEGVYQVRRSIICRK